jgi:hypothetical protein
MPMTETLIMIGVCAFVIIVSGSSYLKTRRGG